MIVYEAIWMGPISKEWCDKHGNGWSGGRINVYGTGEEYPPEMGLPLMDSNDWMSFSSWLYNYETEKVHNLIQLIEEYEKTHRPIRWFEK